MSVKQTTVRGKYIGGVFNATGFQVVSDGLTSSSIRYSSPGVIANILRIRHSERVSTHGFTYAFPIVFTD